MTALWICQVIFASIINGIWCAATGEVWLLAVNLGILAVGLFMFTETRDNAK